jgi:hypothetical protein
MKRPARERGRSVRVWRVFRSLNSGIGTFSGDGWVSQPGRFRKARRIGGCGRARCRLCHSGKIDGRPTRREERARFELREALREAGLAALDRRQRLRA